VATKPPGSRQGTGEPDMYKADGVWMYVCVFVLVCIQVSCNIDGYINTFQYFGEVLRKLVIPESSRSVTMFF
jgi:hypothetical protein